MKKVSGTKLSSVPQHTHYTFEQVGQPAIEFSSEFESGNLGWVERHSYGQYNIWTSNDAAGTPYQTHHKSWFYFSVGGFKPRTVHFTIYGIAHLLQIARKSAPYRPVFRVIDDERSEWHRLTVPATLTINLDDEVNVSWAWTFTDTIKKVQFAFTYPYTHEQCRQNVQELAAQYQLHADIYLRHVQLCKSVEGRQLDLLQISSHEGKQGFEQIKTEQNMIKLLKYKPNKPIILFTARVHPIEVPASHTINGIIKFLLDEYNYCSFLLRKHFVFLLVPMLNPDGVSNGHCRVDTLGQNLNRFYKDPDAKKQPSCHTIKKLVEHYQKDSRIFMYVDLHGHPGYRGNFMFGNAIYDFVGQVESQVYGRVLAENCINFDFPESNFSEKQMKSKDKNEEQTKEGCGRVVMYKEFGIIHSYTIECGYHYNMFNNILDPLSNPGTVYICRYYTNKRGEHIYDGVEQEHRPDDEYTLEKRLEVCRIMNNQYGYKQFGYVEDALDNKENRYYKRETVFYNTHTFNNLGRNLCMSLLDVWKYNPYSRIECLDELRRQIAFKEAKNDRFRKEQAGVKTKAKLIHELVDRQIYEGWQKRMQTSQVKQIHEETRSRQMRIKYTADKGKLEEKHTYVHSRLSEIDIGDSLPISSKKEQRSKTKEVRVRKNTKDTRKYNNIANIPNLPTFGNVFHTPALEIGQYEKMLRKNAEDKKIKIQNFSIRIRNIHT